MKLKRQEAQAVGYKDVPYDALLDQFEPGATTAERTLNPLRPTRQARHPLRMTDARSDRPLLLWTAHNRRQRVAKLRQTYHRPRLQPHRSLATAGRIRADTRRVAF